MVDFSLEKNISAELDLEEPRERYLSLKRKNIKDIILENYELIELIGKGGFGIVFKAYSRIQKKYVALKFLDPETTSREDSFKRVIREINNAQNIKDKRIVSIYSIEKWDGIIFLVMELYEGETLRDILLRKEYCSWEEFKPVYLDIIGSVKVLHDNNIVHRDMKPSNIFITEEKQVVLLDFGLSKKLDENNVTLTTDKMLGTIAYMSPEQLNPNENKDHRSDIYQLGLILYESIYGKLPYEGDTASIMVKKLYNKPDFPTLENSKLPKYLHFGIGKALEREPVNRFKSTSEMIEYFEKEHYPFLGKTIQRIKKKPKTSFFILLIFILSILFTGSFIKNNSKFDSIEHMGTKLKAYNPYGFKLWERDFAPNKISRSVKTHILPNGISSEYDNFSSELVAEVFLNSPKLKIFSQNKSIRDETDDNQYVILNSKGEQLSKFSFSQKFFYNKFFDFSRRFYITDYNSIDIDNDGIKETFMRIRHAGTMYPSAFVYKERNLFRSFTNPGAIHRYWYIYKKDKRRIFLLNGRNNLICHLDFIAEINLNNDNIFGIPNFQSYTKQDINSFLVFFPTNSNVVNIRWKDKGEMEFVDSRTNDRILIKRNNELVVDNGFEKRTYIDRPNILHKAYSLINTAYKEKNKYYNLDNAYEAICKVFKLPIQNPYLISAFYYLKGDIEISLGDFKNGKKSLELSLKKYPGNTDSIQRLSEIDFLNGKFNEAIKYVKKLQDSGTWFWGLTNGNGLFIFYCTLSNGDFISAKEFSDGKLNSDTDKNGSEKTIFSILRSIYKIFKGEYNSSKALLTSIENNHFDLFTVPEFRLFHARAILLDHLINNKSTRTELKKSRFYFRDLKLNTYSYTHFCTISELYLGLLNNNREFKVSDIELKLKSSFDYIIKKSKGDFFTKFWLFYDSYIYATAMEKLNNNSEALRGYKACIKANPHTDLAKRSKNLIEQLELKKKDRAG